MFKLLPDNLSNRQRDEYLQDICVTDLRSTFVLIANLEKQITELQLNKSGPVTFNAVDNPADAEPGSRSADLVVHARCNCSSGRA